MDHLPQNDDQLVEQMNRFMQWLHDTDRDTRIEMMRGILKACPLVDMKSLSSLASHIMKHKQRELALGRNPDAMPLFINVPNKGITLLEGEEILWFQADNFGIMQGVDDYPLPPANPGNNGVDENVGAANVDNEMAQVENGHLFPPANQNNIVIQGNDTLRDYAVIWFNAFLHLFHNPQNPIDGNP